MLRRIPFVLVVAIAISTSLARASSQGCTSADDSEDWYPKADQKYEVGSCRSKLNNTLTVELNGQIQAGLWEKIESEIIRASKQFPAAPKVVVSLNSVGGNANEGRLLALNFYNNKISTRVNSNRYCDSACGIAFLGGTQVKEHDIRAPDRALDIDGQLTFHRPATLTNSADIINSVRNEINCRELNKKLCNELFEKKYNEKLAQLYANGSDIVSKLMSFSQRLGLNNIFISMFLQYDAWQSYEIDSVGRANFATIRLVGLRRAPGMAEQEHGLATSEHIARSACANRILSRYIEPDFVLKRIGHEQEWVKILIKMLLPIQLTQIARLRADCAAF